MSSAPYGLKLPRTLWEQQHKEHRDVIGEIDTSPAGNTILRVGKENVPGGPWHQTAHIVLTPDEAWEFAAEVADKQPPPSVIKLARQVVEMWGAGSGAYDYEEVDAAMTALMEALPPKHHPPVDPDAAF